MAILKCHFCLKELNIDVPVGRQESCDFCGADLHCCLNCKFHRIGAYNDCREPQAERVIEKNRSNFCHYFSIKAPSQNGKEDSFQRAENARKELESIFKKD